VPSLGFNSGVTTPSIGRVFMGRKPLDYDSPHQDEIRSKKYNPERGFTVHGSDPLIPKIRRTNTNTTEVFGKRISDPYAARNSLS